MATIFPWRHGWQTRSFSNFNLGNPRIRPSELSLDNKSKLKCPSILCHFHKSEEGPANKQQGGPREVPEKSTKKTRSRGKIRQTKSPLESKTREQPSLKQTSNPSLRSCETESKLNPRFETKATSLRVKRSETRTAPSPRPFLFHYPRTQCTPLSASG